MEPLQQNYDRLVNLVAGQSQARMGERVLALYNQDCARVSTRRLRSLGFQLLMDALNCYAATGIYLRGNEAQPSAHPRRLEVGKATVSSNHTRRSFAPTPLQTTSN